MKLVLEIHGYHGNADAISYVTVDSFPFKIGRGYDNHLIIADPYVSPNHADISFNGTTFNVHDLNSENGVTVINDKGEVTSRRAPTAPVKSGDRFRIGQTEIRVYDPHHVVPKALPVQKDNVVLLKLGKPYIAWPLFASALSIMLGWTYLEVWTEETGFTLAMALGGSATAILVWSAIWATAGRLVRHQSSFTAHVGLFSLYMIFSTFFWYIEAYADFLTNENLIGTIVSYVLNFILLTPLIYGALRLSTRMNRARRRTAALFFSGGLMGGILLFGLVSAKNFEQAPFYAATLEPYLSGLAKAETVDSFMSENKAFFDRFDKP